MSPREFALIRAIANAGDVLEKPTEVRLLASLLGQSLDALKQAACASLSTECHGCRKLRGHEGPCR